MTESEAQRRFEPYIEWFRYCFQEAWNWYTQVMHPLDDSRFRATAIQNRAVIVGRQSFREQPGIKEHEYRTRRLFVLQDWGVIQFKKLDEELHAINSPNETSVAFDSQQELPGLICYPRFTVGYSPNESHTRYSLFIVHSKTPSENNWFLNITEQSVLVTPDMFGDKDARSSAPTRRVRLKEGIVASDGESAAKT